MSDENEQPDITPEEQQFEKEISIEINKLEHYLEDITQLIENLNNYSISSLLNVVFGSQQYST